MLNFPHYLLFVPIAVFALAFVAAAVVSEIAGFAADSRRRPVVKPAVSRPSAKIITFSPRKISLPSPLDAVVRQQAMSR